MLNEEQRDSSTPVWFNLAPRDVGRAVRDKTFPAHEEALRHGRVVCQAFLSNMSDRRHKFWLRRIPVTRERAVPDVGPGGVRGSDSLPPTETIPRPPTFADVEHFVSWAADLAPGQ